MKKIITVWAIILMVFLYAQTLFVQAEPATDSELTQTAAALKIDDKNIYEGMDKAYQSGYSPQVKNGMATVIIPLVSQGEIRGDKIIATPSLGDPSSSPFVFKNYQKTVELSQNAVNHSSKSVLCYLVRFDFALNQNRINSSYPVTVSIEAEGEDGSPVIQSFTSYITITDGKPYGSEPLQASQPKVMIDRYSIDPSAVTAGKEFSVRITLKNTDDTQPVKNMSVMAVCESQNISLQKGNGTAYIKSLGKGKETEFLLEYKSDLETPEGRYKISLEINYENEKSAAFLSSESVIFEVVQPLRAEMEVPQIPAQVNTGDAFSVAVQVMNLGRGKVYNVRAELSAPGLFLLESAFIGNMEAGTAAPGEMSVLAMAKDSSEGGESEKYGRTNGAVTLIYEDSAGREYKKEFAFTTTINETAAKQNTPENQAEEPQRAGQWWIFVTVIVLIAASLSVFLIVKNKQRKI